METYGFARPGLAPQAPEYRPSGQRGAVATDLDSANAVASASTAERPRERPQERSAARSEDKRREHAREFDFAQETGDLVYKALDVTTGEVVWQWPAQSMIRLREYLQNEVTGQIRERQAGGATPQSGTVRAVDRLA